MPKVDIGVACAPTQINQWWVPLMQRLLVSQQKGIEIGRIHAVSSALPDHNKNYVVDDQQGRITPNNTKRRDDLTDANRVRAAGGFLGGDADWLFFIDDDTVPPEGALEHLLNLGKPFVGGVYYLGKFPHNPIAYYKQDDGTYAALVDYPHGALIEVDSIGMGCTLLHRSVFEEIQKGHKVYQRPNGSLYPMPLARVKNNKPNKNGGEAYVKNGWMHEPLLERSPEDKRPWPFYALEYGRTEDHYFCELAANVGIKPYLDTAVVCDHWKQKAVNRVAHKMAVTKMKSK